MNNSGFTNYPSFLILSVTPAQTLGVCIILLKNVVNIYGEEGEGQNETG